MKTWSSINLMALWCLFPCCRFHDNSCYFLVWFYSFSLKWLMTGIFLFQSQSIVENFGNFLYRAVQEVFEIGFLKLYLENSGKTIARFGFYVQFYIYNIILRSQLLSREAQFKKQNKYHELSWKRQHGKRRRRAIT